VLDVKSKLCFALLLSLMSTAAFADNLPRPRNVAPFNFTDGSGQAVQKGGQPTLVFFGFTKCPDVCPAALAVLAQVKRQLPGTRILFISVDPSDTLEQLRAYTEAFGVVGAKGDFTALMHSMSIHWHDDPNLNNHPSAVYGFNREGKWVSYYRQPLSADSIVAGFGAFQ
jgi:protein SCO1